MNTGNEKNRGYLKIEGAARAFDFDFRDKVVLDIGSSTGGFTQYALEKGARKVIAIEKGTNQMIPGLRDDPRVELHEKTDVFNVVTGRTVAAACPPGTLRAALAKSLCPAEHVAATVLPSDITPAPDIILADVSFTPLTKILNYAKMNLARSDTDFLVMLKPQFETTNKTDLNRGVVKNEAIRRKIIKNFEQWLRQNGFLIVNKRDNDLAGRHGNTERFYHLRLAK